VFTALVEGLGTKGVQFDELFSLDAEGLTRLSPVYGVIFLFKYLSGAPRGSEPIDGNFDADATVFFAQQTIQNACGTQALLSVILNAQDIDIGQNLEEFKLFTSDMPSDVSS